MATKARARTIARTIWKLWPLAVAFSLSIAVLYYFGRYLSSFLDGNSSVYLPTSLEELKTVCGALRKLSEDHSMTVFLFCSLAYLFKQTFAIPGSALLNILAGALFGPVQGLILVSFLSACGASCCYLLSRLVLKEVVEEFFPSQLARVQSMVTTQAHSALYVMISLRLVPVTPNWLLNIISPVIGVPLPLFFLSVLIGLIPYNYTCVQAGTILFQLTSLEDLISLSTIIKLTTIAIFLFVPTYLVRAKSKHTHTSV
jgi:uncharacterized membrane protein YdjX (TVP38/TMEM64 family)